VVEREAETMNPSNVIKIVVSVLNVTVCIVQLVTEIGRHRA
jgi:hypothetical protein